MRVISELAQTAYPLSQDNPAENTVIYHIIVRDLDVAWSIGVFDSEHHRMQPIRINLDLEAIPLDDWDADDYDTVPCYANIADRIQDLAAEGHVKLVETLANRIAEICFEDPRILTAKIRVEKPEALANASFVGVEITRSRA